MDDVVVRDAECPVCSWTARCAERAVSARLGKSMRALLLNLDRPLVLAFYGPSGEPMTATQLSRRRNHVYRLKKCGLVTVGRRQRQTVEENPALAFAGKEWARSALLRRTPLGEHIVALLREELGTDADYVVLSRATVEQARAAAVAGCSHLGASSPEPRPSPGTRRRT